jgi:hypothetical protein
MQEKLSEMQKSRFVIGNNYKFDGHEKNSFRNIVVVLRVLDKLKWNIEVIPLCPSSTDSQKDQNTKNCIPKWL